MLQGPAPSCFWVFSGICVLWDFIFIFFMSFLWVIEKSLQKTLLTNQLELKECGVSGGHTIVGLLLEPNPAALRERGLACSLSLPSSWPSVPALQAPLLPRHSCVLAFECLWRCP